MTATFEEGVSILARLRQTSDAFGVDSKVGILADDAARLIEALRARSDRQSRKLAAFGGAGVTLWECKCGAFQRSGYVCNGCGHDPSAEVEP